MTTRTRIAATFNPTVHGARGLFALSVFGFHVLDSVKPVYTWAQGGWIGLATHSLQYGVELFFCVSGFVILGALHRAASPGQFLLDRVARIGPVLWASVLFFGVMGVALGVREFGTLPLATVLAMLPLNLVALPGIFTIWPFHEAAWSLSYEFAFYLLAATAVWLAARIGRAAAAIVWVPAAAALLIHYPRGAPILSGVLVAIGLLHRLPGPVGTALRAAARCPGLAIATFLICWSAVEAMGPPGIYLHMTSILDWTADARLLLGILALAAVTVGFQGLVDGAGPLSRLLRTRVMMFMGTISYSFYMWHGLGMSVVRRTLPLFVADMQSTLAMIAFPLLSLALAVPMAAVSHRVLEVRATIWLRRVLTAQTRPSMTAAGSFG